jgi:spore maturation protein CgeB
MRFLIVGSLYHPEELAAHATEAPIFPPSQCEYFIVRSLRREGHTVEGFLRNLPVLFGVRNRKTASYAGPRLLMRVIGGVLNRAPRLNADLIARNRRLIAQTERFRPDAVVMVGNNRAIFPETLDRLRQQARILFMSGDSPIVFASPFERAAAPLYDVAVVNDLYHGVQWLELGARRMEVLPISACDPDYHRPYPLTDAERAEFACDVGFIGTLTPPNLYSERVAALEAVCDLGLAVWSVHGVPSVLSAAYRGPALGERTFRIMSCSKIQINPHANSMRYGGNMRLFEAAGCGAFQIADDRPGIATWFTPDETIVTYRDPRHLRDLVTYYLAHDDERRQIAEAAQVHVYAHHTYDHRARALVELVKTL